jgi:5-methylcytosine-specific restriction protein B
MPPIQKILFGSPGTGKSYKVREIAQQELGIEWNEQTQSLKNTIKTVFHPEYTYSDFVGKLLPQTTGSGSIIYKFYEGHFLRALGLAYKKIIDGTNENVLLVIDELNRGNAAAIFGSIFQLLDRDEDDWSSYEVNLSELEIVGLWRAMGYKAEPTHQNIQIDGSNFDKFCDLTENELWSCHNYDGLRVLENLKNHCITIPYNLSIIATINTSDESIYYLDSAFKRRWDWEYVDVPNSKSKTPEEIKDVLVVIGKKQYYWHDLVIKLNEFIKSQNAYVRRIKGLKITNIDKSLEENVKHCFHNVLDINSHQKLPDKYYSYWNVINITNEELAMMKSLNHIFHRALLMKIYDHNNFFDEFICSVLGKQANIYNNIFYLSLFREGWRQRDIDEINNLYKEFLDKLNFYIIDIKYSTPEYYTNPENIEKIKSRSVRKQFVYEYLLQKHLEKTNHPLKELNIKSEFWLPTYSSDQETFTPLPKYMDDYIKLTGVNIMSVIDSYLQTEEK